MPVWVDSVVHMIRRLNRHHDRLAHRHGYSNLYATSYRGLGSAKEVHENRIAPLGVEDILREDPSGAREDVKMTIVVLEALFTNEVPLAPQWREASYLWMQSLCDFFPPCVAVLEAVASEGANEVEQGLHGWFPRACSSS